MEVFLFIVGISVLCYALDKFITSEEQYDVLAWFRSIWTERRKNRNKVAEKDGED